MAERLHARRRLVGLPSTAGAMLLGISERASGEDLLDWLAVQLVAFTSETPDRAAVYMLSAPASVYLGYSGRRVADAGVNRLSTLDSRCWEHFRDIERARHSHGYTKVSCFSKVDASMLVMTAVAVGPRTDMLCLERILIRMVSPSANATYASVKGWRNQVMYGPPSRPPRRRPPPRRRSSHMAPTSLQSALERLPAEVARHSVREAVAAQRHETQALRECNFSEAYDAFRAVHLRGAAGPISILPPEFVDLQISCLCSRTGHMPWHQIRRRCGVGHLYRLGFLLLKTSRMGRLRLGVERWSRQMDLWGELPWTFRPLPIPRNLSPPAARLLIRQLLGVVARGNAWRLRWLQARLRPVRSATRTHAQERFTMPHVCRTSETSRLDLVPPERREEALAGGDMRRYKMYWKLPVHQTSTALWHEAASSADEWLRRYSRFPDEEYCLGAAYAAALPALLQPEPAPAPESEFLAYVSALPSPQPDELVVVEDKDTAAGWLCSVECYLLRTQHYIEFDGVWTRTNLTLEQTGACLRELFKPLVVLGALRDLPLGRWISGIPSVYSTVKFKCWRESKHVCVRDNHCLLR